MPKHVVVVGAGVVGLACASVLRQRGRAVTLVDPGAPGEGCSLGNAGCFSRASFVPLGMPGTWKKVPGWLADPAGPLTIPLAYLPRIAPWLWGLQRASTVANVQRIADALRPLMDASLDRWKPLAAWAGVPELVVERGYAWAYESEAAFQGDAFGRRLRVERGVQLEVLTGGAIRELEPGLSPAVTHLVYMPQQGHCPNPLRLSQALAARLRADGARFHAHRALDFRFVDGKVAAVVTDAGDVAADAVVIAAGAFSKPLAAKLGSPVPLETERGYHVMLEPAAAAPTRPVMSGEGKFFATPMEGGLRVAGTVELAGLEAPPNYARADVLAGATRRLFPGASPNITSRWMGHRPSLPDSLPVLGRSPRFANAYFAFGHGHVGLTGAAPTAEVVADLVEGRNPFLPVHPFRADRF